GDINLDGDVNNADFSKLSRQWQQTGCDDCQGADLTGDGNVTVADFLVLAQNWLNFTIIPGLQTPFPEGLAHTIPGRLEFEDYDFGGQGISYFDTTDQNAYGNYRWDDVDILPSDDIDEGLAVYAVASEWREYTCDILPGTYTVTVRSSSPQPEQVLTLSLQEQTLATVSLPTTGGFNSWQDTTIEGITIPAGSEKTLAFNLDTSTAMLNYVDFVQN
ncbi:MAG: carbohydrate-binding domain-containing protein, partial [Planctomycetota bacterium]